MTLTSAFCVVSSFATGLFTLHALLQRTWPEPYSLVYSASPAIIAENTVAAVIFLLAFDEAGETVGWVLSNQPREGPFKNQ